MRVLGGVGGADSVVDTAVGRLSRWFEMHLQRGEDESVEPLQVTIALDRYEWSISPFVLVDKASFLSLVDKS